MWYAVFQNMAYPEIVDNLLPIWLITQKVTTEWGETEVIYERIGNPFEAKSFEQATKKWRNYIFRVLPINARLG